MVVRILSKNPSKAKDGIIFNVKTVSEDETVWLIELYEGPVIRYAKSMYTQVLSSQ